MAALCRQARGVRQEQLARRGDGGTSGRRRSECRAGGWSGSLCVKCDDMRLREELHEVTDEFK